MITDIGYNIFRFFLLVFIQVLFLVNLTAYNIAVPFLYVLFILLLPVSISKFNLFLLSFLTGLTVDIFSNSLGLHAAACVFMAAIRLTVLTMIAPSGRGGEMTIHPGMQEFGFKKFFIYSGVLVFCHHLFLFNLDYFTFADIPIASYRALISSLSTLTLIIVSQYLFVTGKNK